MHHTRRDPSRRKIDPNRDWQACHLFATACYGLLLVSIESWLECDDDLLGIPLPQQAKTNKTTSPQTMLHSRFFSALHPDKQAELRKNIGWCR
ncbi:hypothetical protein BJX96DRAFT_161222 [Aspergillus floccosus]